MGSLSNDDCDGDEKVPNFLRPLHGVGELNTKIFVFFFLNSDTVLPDSPQKILPTFGKLNEIEKKKCCSLKQCEFSF